MTTSAKGAQRDLLACLPSFVRQRVAAIVSPEERTSAWKWPPGALLAHKGQRRAILACGWDVHGDPIYLIQTDAGRVNIKGAFAGNAEYGPVLGQVAEAFSLRRAGALDRAARRASSKRGAVTLRARRASHRGAAAVEHQAGGRDGSP